MVSALGAVSTNDKMNSLVTSYPLKSNYHALPSAEKTIREANLAQI